MKIKELIIILNEIAKEEENADVFLKSELSGMKDYFNIERPFVNMVVLKQKNEK
jgi:hypothetical protein